MRVVFANKQVIIFKDWEQASARANSFMESGDVRVDYLRDLSSLSKKEKSRRKKSWRMARISRRRNR